MGASLTNVQVQVVGDAASTRAKVIAAIREHVAQGVELYDVDDPATADRRVVVGGDDRWIAVYDEETENQDFDALGALASALSRATGGAAVSVLVHDSSATYLELFSAGQARDRWCSKPDWFGPMTAKGKAAWAGRPDAWSKAIPGVKASAIAAAWKKKVPVFAEEYLEHVGKVLGWNRVYVDVGYHYLQDELEDREDELVTLALRVGEGRPPAVETRGEPMVPPEEPLFPADYNTKLDAILAQMDRMARAYHAATAKKAKPKAKKKATPTTKKVTTKPSAKASPKAKTKATSKRPKRR